MDTIQQQLDQLSYPPTHTYDYRTLTPTGVLTERLRLIETVAPEFFLSVGQRFLDVGCNKGFFSLYGSQFFQEVVGIDNRFEFTTICNHMRRPNTKFVLSSFRQFTPTQRFDRIFIGNGPHYLYTDASGTYI